MDELVRTLKNFIVRDIIYIIRGASVILSFLYLFNRICFITGSDSTFVWLFAIGISYVIGYCIQEFFSLIRFVTTANYFQPWRPIKWLYRLSQHEEWEGIFPDITDEQNPQQEISRKMSEADIKINEKASPDNKAFRERITSHMMIGTTIGPCGFVSGILLLIKACILNRNCSREFNIWLTICVLLISILLILFGWIKGLQFMKNTEALYNSLQKTENT